MWEALERFLSQDLVSSAPAAAGPYDDLVSFSSVAWHEELRQFVKVFYKSLRAALVEILVTCCQGPLHDLVQVLARST